MNTSTHSLAATLNSLIETCKDGQQGFRSAGEDVHGNDFQTLFSELALQRQEYAEQLQGLVTSFGEEPEDSGSVTGAVHRGWIDLKSALLSGDQHAILVECERGEDSAVAEYQEALERSDLPANVRAIIRQQYMGIQAAHDRVRDLRDRFAD